MEILSLNEFNGHGIACVFNDTGSKNIVIFCHGYRSDSIGPNRFFVIAARQLAESNISSLRFDQYGSGNSEGDFIDSSFNDWVGTAKSIAKHYIKLGYNVALFGQSMGAATSIVAAADIPELNAMVAWVPDPSVDVYVPPKNGLFEEQGQIVRSRYWQEAHDSQIPKRLSEVEAPAYIVQCTDDVYVDEENRLAVENAAKPQHIVETFEGYTHSSWNFDQATEIINKSVDFIIQKMHKL